VSHSLMCLSMYSKITLGIILSSIPILVYFISKTEEGGDVNNYACWLLFESGPPLIIMVIIKISIHLPGQLRSLT